MGYNSVLYSIQRYLQLHECTLQSLRAGLLFQLFRIPPGGRPAETRLLNGAQTSG